LDVIATKKKRSAVNRYTIADFHFRTSAARLSKSAETLDARGVQPLSA